MELQCRAGPKFEHLVDANEKDCLFLTREEYLGSSGVFCPPGFESKGPARRTARIAVLQSGQRLRHDREGRSGVIPVHAVRLITSCLDETSAAQATWSKSRTRLRDGVLRPKGERKRRRVRIRRRFRSAPRARWRTRGRRPEASFQAAWGPSLRSLAEMPPGSGSTSQRHLPMAGPECPARGAQRQ